MFEVPETFDFDLATGLCLQCPPMHRRLSSMANMFHDDEAVKRVLPEDPVIYSFYDMGVPARPTDLAFGTSICHPGKIGDEYYMTKGHYHEIRETAEVYYCKCGQGIMLMETLDGRWSAKELVPGRVVYVPGGWAHRSINTGHEPFITFYVFRSDAGHDYATIEKMSFRKMAIEEDGKPRIVDNPKWGKPA
ncbi:MAG TPA: glucose-6-phosphate isomerase family protein [Clostridia bacterium]